MRRAHVSALAVALALAATGCTGAPGAGGSTPRMGAPPSPSRGAPTLSVEVVAALSGPDVTGAATYLDGMRLAVAQLNAMGGVAGRRMVLAMHDDRGNPAEASTIVHGLARAGTAAILYVGTGTVLPSLRTVLEQAGVPVLLMEGDLYTSRQLFPQVFQVSIPWIWQARVIARYLVKDRREARIAFVGLGPEAGAAMGATRAALQYWGGSLGAGIVLPAGASTDRIRGIAPAADALVDFGAPSDALRVAEAAASSPDGAPRVAAGEALLAAVGARGALASGSVACFTYTWDRWAQPIPRVGRFIQGFQAETGHRPSGLEQEGYDAVQVLARGLRLTGGRAGQNLISALETTHDLTRSGFPVDLGPDDHLFPPRDELGLFAVAGPGERLDPWQSRSSGEPAWRPIMRTFTYDGRRDNVLDQDKRVFFPSWRLGQAGPFYWQSRYGIVSRPSDPTH